MEFPNLGANCAVSTCRKLDFLPVQCSGCHSIFCKDHYSYNSHNCKNPDIQDKQVPVCPLCGTIVPLRPGELPDVQVGNHIDTACRSKPALELKGKLFTNACCMHRCKKKELVPFICDGCKLNFCISHRNELDHECKGFQGNQNTSRKLSSTGAAALYRAIFNNSNKITTSKDESLTTNLQSSSPVIQHSTNSHTIEDEEDFQLALALSASLENKTTTSQPTRRTSSKSPSCTIS
ncbi:unnamed protein product [Heterobilharzia americana]|nr:unnamed protein product [Heterobilharzia americana]CAH8533824.1 unnamed protein product [Heterobilharzia americana]